MASPKSDTAAGKWKWFWKGCKPNFVCASCPAERIICLSSQYPGPGFRRGAGSSGVPYLALHPMGFSVPRRLRFARWSLTPPFHPCRFQQTAAVCFLWHFPSESLATFRPRVSQSNGLELRGITPCGVRTFLPRLTPEAILRLSKTGVIIPHSGGKTIFER